MAKKPDDVLVEKLVEAEWTPGLVIELTPAEADRAGACPEDAMSDADALESTTDMLPLLEARP